MKYPITFTLTERELDTKLTSSNAPIDVLALASGFSTMNDSDYLDGKFENRGLARQYVIDNYNFEDAYLAYLNKTNDPKDGLESGAWFALNQPDQFSIDLLNWTDRLKEDAHAYEMLDTIPADLSANLGKADDEASDDYFREWFYGDHRNWDGILSLSSRAVTGEHKSFSWDKETGDILVTLSEDEVQTILGEDEKITSVKRVKEVTVETINSLANNTVHKNKIENEKRRAEYQKTKEYQDKRKAEDEAKRKAKLLAMTRA